MHGHDAPDLGPKINYLSLGNEEKNQMTMTSINSGNLALYEVQYTVDVDVDVVLQL